MRIFILAFTVFLLMGCEKNAGLTTNYATLQNATVHHIKLVGYVNGQVFPPDVIELGPGEEVTIGDGRRRGMDLSQTYGFDITHFASSDSVVVIFDNQYKTTHYTHYNPPTAGLKAILYSDSRNITNYKSYEPKQTLSKYIVRDSFFYRFVEADYLFAHG